MKLKQIMEAIVSKKEIKDALELLSDGETYTAETKDYQFVKRKDGACFRCDKH